MNIITNDNVEDIISWNKSSLMNWGLNLGYSICQYWVKKLVKANSIIVIQIESH
jgi:hypothetical protein